jgi:hypothetical protein
LEAKSRDIRGRDRSKHLQPKRRKGRQSDFVTVGAKSCINPISGTANPDTYEVATGRKTNPFVSDRNDPVKLSAKLGFHRQRRSSPVASQSFRSPISRRIEALQE